MTIDDANAGIPVPDAITTLAAELGIELRGVAGDEDVAACEERLDIMAQLLDAWGPMITGGEKDVPVIEWTVDYALVAILGLDAADREKLMSRYVDVMLIYWYKPLLRVMPLQTVKARLLAAALDKKELTDSQVKMLRFKYKRSMEGLGNR